MLTPKQLSSHEFQLAGRNAYKAADVDEFLDEVTESYEQMFRENGELVKKLNLVADKLQQYKADEDNIRNALLTAERMKESIVQEAEESVKSKVAEGDEKAAEIIAEANEKAEEILKLAQANATKLLAKAQELYDDQVSSIKDEAEKEEAHLLKIKEESAKVRADLIDSYQKQISILEFTPDFSEEVRLARQKKIDEIEEKVEEITEEVVEEAEEIEQPAEDFSDLIPEDDEPEVEVEIEYADDEEETDEEAIEFEEDDEDEADVDEYLDDEEEEFEDIDSGKDLFSDDDDEDDDDEEEISLF